MFYNFLLFTLLLQSGLAIAAPPPPPPIPSINASAYLLMDFHSGVIVAEKNSRQVMEPASLTKIMTIYVVANELRDRRIKLNDQVPVSERAWRMSGSRMFIEVGEHVSLEELMKGDIVQSGNDASVALAEYVSGSEEIFAAVMNQHAARLGLTDSNFANSTGLPDDSHLTSARDVALLSARLISEFPDIYKMFSIREFTYNDIKQHNRNRLLFRDDSVDGVKTGYTKSAGYCLVASAVRDGRRMISVVMGAPSEVTRTTASLALLNYGFRFYETRRLFKAEETISSVKIWKGERDSLDLGLSKDLYVTVPVGHYADLKAAVDLDAKLVAPISKGEAVGTLRVTSDEREIVTKPVVSLHEVSSGNVLARLLDEIQLLFE